MSLVGNISTNVDRTTQAAGSPLQRRMSNFGRGGANVDDDAVEEVFTPMEQRHEEIVQLARTMSRHSISRQTSRSSGGFNPLARIRSNASTVVDGPRNPLEYEEGSDLDPYSENFNIRKWAKIALKNRGDEPSRKSGLSWKNMSVFGYGSDADYQKTVGNIPWYMIQSLRDLIMGRKRKVDILNSFDGLLEAGEMLVVLGPPGSGCTTLLKTIAGEMNGIYLDEGAEINYRGISPKQMLSQFRGEAIYTAEVDVHFPKLVVGDTLSFAARARAPANPPAGMTQTQYANHMRDVTMAIFGISHTINTMVGNDFIRGVSGGERKRVSIAEASLAAAPLQCWDNSTRGLDAANAIEFVKNLKLGTDYFDNTAVVAIYQAPQAAYDLFDKVSVLYEGEQIYFGRCDEAKAFFVNMGFFCPEQQTTPDFLTSLTSAAERTPRAGFEGKVPHTPKQFAERWRASPQYAALQQQIAAYNQRHPIGGEAYDEFLSSRRQQQHKHTRVKSPYTLSYWGQVKLCLLRGFQRLKADPSLTITQLFGNCVMALIISSVFYNLQPDTSSFFNRGGLLFFAILMNAFGSALEILTLYAQRPIVEKHAQYAFYHPSAEAFASMLTDMPYKIINSIFFNLIIYFMTNLRREPGPFFFFYLVSFLCTLVMSMLFRSIASLSRSLTQALAPAAIIILALIIYTGFALPITYMHGWSRWINYLDPIAYGFESLMVNEFHGRQFACSNIVPQGPGYPTSGDGIACAAVGSVPGQPFVDGDRYLELAFKYYHSHKWRNVGILFVFMFGLMVIYLVAAEFISAKKSKGEVLIYPRGKIPAALLRPNDEETATEVKDGALSSKPSNLDAADGLIQRQTAIFSWKDVCYDIKIKGQPRRILDHVDGWVKPGTLTALMGVSGAGKTTLLDVLATRVTMGVVTGEMLVDGRPRDVSFQRKTGYVQQQDLHLETSTVREALRFSAVLRQPKKVPRAEKYAYVEDVLKLLEMDSYADAVVGVPGEGLNVEQRKRLTIGVELVAKPELLLFLDEPTSGLDSQTSWNILQLLQKLTANGQAILCTIHQPSAMLFEQFDRLLFLAKGGKTVYYGEVGNQSSILIDYFVRNGAPECPPGANPAEWMLSAIGAAPGSHTDVDWHQAWLNSPERVAVREELSRLKHERRAVVPKQDKSSDKAAYAEFAAGYGTQFFEVLRRVFQQYWRTPSYIWSKLALVTAVGLFVGFSFYRAGTSQQGLQNQLFSIFMIFTIFGQLVQQIMPNFVIQRALYEVRERPSKTYSWKVFILSNIIVEIPWQMLVGTILYFEFYYPVGFYKNATPTNSVALRGALMWLLIQMFMLFTSTFATMIVAGIELAETAGNIANLMFSLCLVFCGVLVPLDSLPGFWKFMNRVSPFTYMVEGMLSTGVANTNVVCSATEYISFNPQGGSCQQYMGPFIEAVGGYLRNPDATSSCQYCALSDTNRFLAMFNIYFKNAWRDFGLLWVYVIFNIFGAIFIYWLARVPKNKRAKDDDEQPLQRTTTDASGITRALTSDKVPATTGEHIDEKAAYSKDAPLSAHNGNGHGLAHMQNPSTVATDSTRAPSPEAYADAKAYHGVGQPQAIPPMEQPQAIPHAEQPQPIIPHAQTHTTPQTNLDSHSQGHDATQHIVPPTHITYKHDSAV